MLLTIRIQMNNNNTHSNEQHQRIQMNKNSIRSTTIHMQMNNNNAIQYMKMQFYIMQFNEQYTLYAYNSTEYNAFK